MRSYNSAIQHPMCQYMLNYLFSSNINNDLYDINQQIFLNYVIKLAIIVHKYKTSEIPIFNNVRQISTLYIYDLILSSYENNYDTANMQTYK